MYLKHPQKTFAALLLVCALAFTRYGYAGTLTIDNFTHTQTAIDFGGDDYATENTVTILTGTDLTDVSRTLLARTSASDSDVKERIVSGNNLLKISNDADSAGMASVVWNFDAIDFTRHGNAILLDVAFIDLGVNVEMTINGTASSGVKSIGGTGNFLVNFGDFTNSSAFGSAHNFSLNFSGPEAWDGRFRILTAFATPVPAPPAFALMGSALIGIMGFARGKSALTSNS
ncbi:MAG: hypothetical protein LUQ11_15875 [Methylococcaceae bacterium]|nr:hypothetical protein [Methylococcaceae bacterium]